MSRPGAAAPRIVLTALTALTLAACAMGGATGPAGPAAEPERARPAAAVPPLERDVALLMGRTAPALRTLLGPAAFARRDGPAEIWRYATDDCFLTVFLHRGEQSRASEPVVRHVEASARTQAAAAWVTPQRCLGQVMQQRGSGATAI
jgi:hypothetical protein